MKCEKCRGTGLFFYLDMPHHTKCKWCNGTGNKFTLSSTLKRIEDLNIVDMHIDGDNGLQSINELLDCIEEADKNFPSIKDIKRILKEGKTVEL